MVQPAQNRRRDHLRMFAKAMTGGHELIRLWQRMWNARSQAGVWTTIVQKTVARVTPRTATARNPASMCPLFNLFWRSWPAERPVAELDVVYADHRGDGEWDAEGIQIKTSIVGTLNDDSDEDSYWILEAAIPFRNFAEVARHTPPRPGDVWHLNLNRLGGNTNPQFSQWSASRTPKPAFHAPDDFGRVIFSDRASPFWR